MNSDFSDLLKLMDQFQVRFLVVGGYAVIRHTEPRFTKDLDLWIEATAENADRCFRALASFGAPLAGLGPLDFTQQGYIVKAEGVVFLRGFGSPKVHRQCPRNFPILSLKVLPTGLLVISVRKGNGEVLRVRKTGVRKMTTSVGR